MTGLHHEPVLLQESLEALAPRPGGVYADVTLGGAGHAAAILEASAPDGRLIGVDRDEVAIEAARARLRPFGDRVEVHHDRLGRLPELFAEAGVGPVSGLIADLGVSSFQLDDAERGFSFSYDGPLDMRMDRAEGPTVAELIDQWDDTELADVIYQYGEERRSRKIARSIRRAAEEAKLETTADLGRAVRRVTGPRRGRTDPATRTFQALRIAVNDELGELERLLDCLPHVLEDEGVAVLISFHSLEDRLVKRAFRDNARLSPLARKPITATDDERAANPRSRSAKLRAARRVPRRAGVTT